MKRITMLTTLAMTVLITTASTVLARRDPGPGANSSSGMPLYNYGSRAPTAPRVSHAGVNNQYSDGMNLYEYVGSNPIRRVDPMGLKWEIKRNKGEMRVEAASGKGDSIYTLAKQTGLSSREWKNWLQFKGKVRLAYGGEKNVGVLDVLCPETKATIPNTFLLVHGQHIDPDYSESIISWGLRKLTRTNRIGAGRSTNYTACHDDLSRRLVGSICHDVAQRRRKLSEDRS